MTMTRTSLKVQTTPANYMSYIVKNDTDTLGVLEYAKKTSSWSYETVASGYIVTNSLALASSTPEIAFTRAARLLSALRDPSTGWGVTDLRPCLESNRGVSLNVDGSGNP